MMTEDSILVVSDAPGDAKLIKRLLDDDFSRVALSTEASQAVADFNAHQPRVLVLGFDAVEKAEDYYLGLHRKIPSLPSLLHRTVLLCNKVNIQRAYELCRKGQFDDYVIFWPLSFDAPRLHMVIYGALRELRRAIAAASHADESLPVVGAKVLAALDRVSKQLAAALPNGATLAAAQGRVAGDGSLSVTDAMNSLCRCSEALVEVLAPAVVSDQPPREPADSGAPRILVVDDDVFQHRVVSHVLVELHADIAFATSGAEAFSMLQQFAPDLILMDFQLPDMDGAKVIRNIKSIESYAAIPVIMITGQRDKNMVLQCKAAGAVDYVGKPFERDTLLVKVRQWLRGVPGAGRAAVHAQMTAGRA